MKIVVEAYIKHLFGISKHQAKKHLGRDRFAE